MNVSPVSFKSLMCFTVDGKKKNAILPKLITAAFSHNNELKRSNFHIEEKETPFEKPIDVTVYNANANICSKLDELYQKDLPRGSKAVFLTKVPVAINPFEVEQRYFLTAATDEDENKIINSSFANSKDFYVAKFRDKNI